MIKANATDSGSGGIVAVWSDVRTDFAGAIDPDRCFRERFRIARDQVAGRCAHAFVEDRLHAGRAEER